MTKIGWKELEIDFKWTKLVRIIWNFVEMSWKLVEKDQNWLEMVEIQRKLVEIVEKCKKKNVIVHIIDTSAQRCRLEKKKCVKPSPIIFSDWNDQLGKTQIIS